jgi:hypothetical protein
MSETLAKFKGQDQFYGRFKKYTPDDANGEPLPDERKEMVGTVNERLAWTAKFVTEMIDHMAAKDKANQKAVSDLKIGETMIKDLPATLLLAMEKKMREIRSYYDAAPTLDMSIQWANDPLNKDKFINGPIYQYRTAKVTTGVEISKGNEKFAPVFEKVEQTVKVGTYETKNTSGALHPEQKAKYLAKIDQLILTVKAARMAANSVEIEKVEIGKVIFDFIHQ